MNNKSMSHIRDFLKQDATLIPGKFYYRPAPAHILSKFGYSLLGKSPFLAKVSAARLDQSELDDLLGKSASRESRLDFMKSLDLLINSDGRSFGKPAFSSYLPLTSSLVSNDPSDDGYGSALFSLFNPEQRSIIESEFSKLLNSTLSNDVVSKSISLMEKLLLPDGNVLSRVDLETSTTKNTAFASAIFEFLITGLVEMNANGDNARRITNIQRLSTFLTGLVALGLIYEGNVLRTLKIGKKTEEDLSPSELLGIVCFTGTPPGPPRNVLVRLSQISLKSALTRSHEGLGIQFLSAFGEPLGKEKITNDTIEDVVLSRVQGQSAVDLVGWISQSVVENDLKSVFNELYPVASFISGFKSLAGKVGLAAPIKGVGEPRIVFETTFLDALAFFMSKEGDPFEKFVDNCYTSLGLIVGRPSILTSKSHERLNLIAGKLADVDECLEIAHTEMRRRLVTSGLAREFSDGFTIMVRK